ncbi:hypothetical protein [Larkinella soli]|uniref:hypothetical protein n=1 Tax=Larkinella soli TaxID=1770527 RepID=UPI000FFC4EAF|nr:hypothetical protein [Larkinella soli]
MKITEALIKAIKERQEKLTETDQLNENIIDAVNLINQELLKQGIRSTINKDDIEFSPEFLWEKTYFSWDPKLKRNLILRKRNLSNIIFNHYYPSPSNTTFYHFTSLKNFESIVKNKELWLFNLLKRFNQGEFRYFYKDHGLTGYKINSDIDGVIMEESLMSKAFYISFARSSSIKIDEEEDLWTSFGESGHGVRIEFDIVPKISDFRNIFYKDDKTPIKDLLINKLSKKIKKKFKRNFMISGISKIGGFYLHSDLKIENETRLLIKEYSDEYEFNFTKFPSIGKVKYIKLRFDSDYAEIKINSVQPGIYCNEDKVREVFEKYPLAYNPSIVNKPNF